MTKDIPSSCREWCSILQRLATISEPVNFERLPQGRQPLRTQIWAKACSAVSPASTRGPRGYSAEDAWYACDVPGHSAPPSLEWLLQKPHRWRCRWLCRTLDRTVQHPVHTSVQGLQCLLEQGLADVKVLTSLQQMLVGWEAKPLQLQSRQSVAINKSAKRERLTISSVPKPVGEKSLDSNPTTGIPPWICFRMPIRPLQYHMC